MTDLRTTAQQALEALLTYEQYIQPLTAVFGGPRVPEEGSASAKVNAAITALRAALAGSDPLSQAEMENTIYRCKELGRHLEALAEPVQEPTWRQTVLTVQGESVPLGLVASNPFTSRVSSPEPVPGPEQEPTNQCAETCERAMLCAVCARELAEPVQEPVAEMPSNTRFTVHVEGQGNTYYDNIHDAMTYAQRFVYASVDATTRALDDLKAARIAEWSYGFSAVRIYPPQKTVAPTPRKPLTDEQIVELWDETVKYAPSEIRIKDFARAIEAKLKEKNERTI